MTTKEEAQAARRKLMMGDLRVILKDTASKRPRPGFAEIEAPSPERLAEACARIKMVNGLELLAFIRDNPGYFASKLFDF